MPKSAVRKLKYRILPGVGPGSFSTEGSVADLLFDIPYFFLARIIPPIQVVNEVLQKGVVDAGMSGGCKWKPFQLNTSSYEELASSLQKMKFLAIQPPNWVTTDSDWRHWCIELVWAIPALENKKQSAEIDKLEAQREAALKAGNEHLAASLVSQVIELSIKHSRFMNEHRASKPKLPAFRRPVTKRKLKPNAYR